VFIIFFFCGGEGESSKRRRIVNKDTRNFCVGSLARTISKDYNYNPKTVGSITRVRYYTRFIVAAQVG